MSEQNDVHNVSNVYYQNDGYDGYDGYVSIPSPSAPPSSGLLDDTIGTDEVRLGINETACPICLEPMTEPTTTSCQHNFHRRCLEHWFERHNTCPVCRAELFEQRLDEPDSTYLFRCINLRCCPAPLYRRLHQIQLIMIGLLWFITGLMIYNYVTTIVTWTNASDYTGHIGSLIIFGCIVISFIFLSYELICLIFRCRCDTGRIYRLELDEFGIDI